MAEVTVKQFAEVVGISIDRLLEQLREAGVEINDADGYYVIPVTIPYKEHFRE